VGDITALIAAEPTVTSSLISIGAGLRLAVTAPGGGLAEPTRGLVRSSGSNDAA
jgi:hypothetical protein